MPNNILLPEQKKALEIAAQIAAKKNSPVYLVGGFLRDALLGRESADLDLGLQGKPEWAFEMARLLANNCKPFLDDYRINPFWLDAGFGIARVVFSPYLENGPNKKFYFDLAILEETIEKDLARRDFTVNALALPLEAFLAHPEDPQWDQILEVPGGKADLKSRIIRPISEENIIADPLRMLRGIRLLAQLTAPGKLWKMAPGTLELFQKHQELINNSALERVREELSRTFLARGLSSSLAALSYTGLLSQIIPYPPLFNSSPNHPARDLTRFMGLLEWLIFSKKDHYPEGKPGLIHPSLKIALWPEVIKSLEEKGFEKLNLLLWTGVLFCLFFNPGGESSLLAQPATQEIFEKIKRILAGLKFSKDAQNHIILILEGQAALDELIGEILARTAIPGRYSGEKFNREIYRFLRKYNPVQLEILILNLAARGVNWEAKENWPSYLEAGNSIIKSLIGEKEERLFGKPRLLDGQDLISKLKIKPGPKVGELLKKIEEAHGLGEISTVDEALELARGVMKAENPNIFQ